MTFRKIAMVCGLGVIAMAQAAFAEDCSAPELRICLHQPAARAEAYQLPCAESQCSQDGAAYELFRFEDGSQVKMTAEKDGKAMMQADLRFVLGRAPKSYTDLPVTVDHHAADHRTYQSDGVAIFTTGPCDSSCEGLDAQTFGK